LGLVGGSGVLAGLVMATSATFLRVQKLLLPAGSPHVRFAGEFVLGMALAGGIAATLFGLAVRPSWSALGLGIMVALAAAIPAFLVDVSLDALGVRWGAGNANMARVVALGFPVCTLSAGAVIGWWLARFAPKR
jgi:hypothetical protein